MLHPGLRLHMHQTQTALASSVLTLNDIAQAPLRALLRSYHLELHTVPSEEDIPGSFWGDDEAGLIKDHLYARAGTPIHSILHEACHYICMAGDRRIGLHTNAGGDYDEENGVCFLQILLAGQLADVGPTRLMQDMDSWGYSFRLGSTARWFADDADDARAWLLSHGLIDTGNRPTWRLRA